MTKLSSRFKDKSRLLYKAIRVQNETHSINMIVFQVPDSSLLVDNIECNFDCSGNSGGEKCGGHWRNSVFATHATYCKGGGHGKLCWKNKQQYNSLISDPVYQGCFGDTGSRTLPHDMVNFNDNHAVRCSNHCRSNNWPVAGLQGGDHCFCGDQVEN